MLREQTVWMAIPTSFNDPFDCQPLIIQNDETDRRNLKQIIKNRLRVIKRALREGTRLADTKLREIPHRQLVEMKKLLESTLPDDRKYQTLKKYFAEPPVAQTAYAILEAQLSRVGVLSLSSTPTDMLMWTHYADQHKGFCMGFERSEGSLLKDEAHTKPVQYFDDYPKLEINALEISWSISVGNGTVSDSVEVDINESHLQAVIYSKAKNWEYEREWRVLVSEGGKPSPFAGPLRKIIFGLRCQPDSKQRIREALDGTEGPVHFAEIEYTKGSFALQVRDLPAQ
jgi:hypothetical protein